MHDPPRILVVDDNETNRDILVTRLSAHGYELLEAADGEEALAAALDREPDLILLDVMMPKLDGIEVCRRLKADTSLPFVPVVLVTAKADTRDIVAGLDAGADEYLTKPVDQAALVARVRSMLRIKALHDQVDAQAKELTAWNRALETRVAEQVGQLARLNRLRRFLAPQIAEVVIASGDERMLESHRRDIAVLFCDLRGFTACAEVSEPEEIMGILREYHACLGQLTHRYNATLDRFTGDGMIALFNDPLPCPEPSVQAVRMAVDMRAAVAQLAGKWRRHGHELGFGVGVAYGYATVGRVGFEDRFDYTAIGSVVNLAARLCGEADAGHILVDSKVQAAVESVAATEPLGELLLKGFHRPVKAFRVLALAS